MHGTKFWNSYLNVAINDPAKYIQLLETVDAGTLSHLVEIGWHAKNPALFDKLVNAFFHPNPLVREGNLMGFSMHGNNHPKVIEILKKLSVDDPDSIIRECIQEYLENNNIKN